MLNRDWFARFTAEHAEACFDSGTARKKYGNYSAINEEVDGLEVDDKSTDLLDKET